MLLCHGFAKGVTYSAPSSLCPGFRWANLAPMVFAQARRSLTLDVISSSSSLLMLPWYYEINSSFLGGKVGNHSGHSRIVVVVGAVFELFGRLGTTSVSFLTHFVTPEFAKDSARLGMRFVDIELGEFVDLFGHRDVCSQSKFHSKMGW
ncbi:hypothetical protein V6N13_001456 [Hibiscus sabdariffa]